MSQVITIDLPTNVAERAQAVATRTHRRVEDVLLEWLGRAATEIPLAWLPDAEILALAHLQLPQAQQTELSQLLQTQREGALSLTDHERLEALLQEYRAGMLRKAEALKIAVERGIHPTLGS
jgi:hypothetical protein